MQFSPEDNLKIYIVLGNKAGSLRAKTAQCNLVRVWLKEGFLVERFLGKMVV